MSAGHPTRDSTTGLVWDWPVRLLHWALALSFAGAWLTSESERWRNWHVAFGYAALAAIVLRILWGLVGTRHARFAAFLRSPNAALDYLTDLMTGRVPHFDGHNPAGGWAIIGLLGAGIATVVTGWLAINERLNGDWHELAANGWIVVVGIHLCGVVVGSIAHRENLVRAMLTGIKVSAPRQRIARPLGIIGALALASVAVAGYAGFAGWF